MNTKVWLLNHKCRGEKRLAIRNNALIGLFVDKNRHTVIV